MLDKIEKVLSKIINAAGVVSAAVMIFMMLYVAADAVMRNLNRSFVGSNELVVNLVVLVIFLGIGTTSVKDAQIKIDVFTFLPKMDHFMLVITAIMYFVAGGAAFVQAQLAAEMQLSSPFLAIPRWPFLVVTGIGLILCGLGALCVEFRMISTRHKARIEKRSAITEVNV